MSSSSSSCSLTVEQPVYDLLTDGNQAPIAGRGGAYPNYVVNNVVDYIPNIEQTTRTGIGIGQGAYGFIPSYSGSSLSMSSCSQSSSSKSSRSRSSSSRSSSLSSSSSSSSSSCSSSSSSASGGSGTPMYGFVFITDVAPVNKSVGSKVYDSPDVLSSFYTDDTFITVSILAGTGVTHYMPGVLVNEQPVSNFILNSYGQWEGSVVVSTGGNSITAIHEDGPIAITTYTQVSTPVITELTFIGGYPGTQTAVKLDDELTIQIASNTIFDYIDVFDYEAVQGQQATVATSSIYNLGVAAATRGTGEIPNQTVKARVRSVEGIWSSTALASDFHATEGTGFITLDNDAPTITMDGTEYPISQEALKYDEPALVYFNLDSECTVLYSSPTGELDIVNPDVYEIEKTVSRISGEYNISIPNCRMVATRVANGAQAQAQMVVNIANAEAVLDMSLPYARLQSSAAGADYVVTLTSNQQLLSTPVVEDLQPGCGEWQGAFTVVSSTSWRRTLRVLDADQKGTFNFMGVSATNLAGLETIDIATGYEYILGGFTSRTLTIDAWPNREVGLGTSVSDVTKLLCLNNSKGVNHPITYKDSVADEVDTFTITSPSGVFNASGDTFFNCDLANAVNNVLGLATITIEETV